MSQEEKEVTVTIQGDAGFTVVCNKCLGANVLLSEKWSGKDSGFSYIQAECQDCGQCESP